MQRAESEEGGGWGLGHLGPIEDGAGGLESDLEGGKDWGPGHADSPNWGQTSQEVRRLTSILSSFFWRCSSFTRCSIRATRVSASSCCARSRRAAPRAPSPVRADAGVTAEVNAGGGASALSERAWSEASPPRSLGGSESASPGRPFIQVGEGAVRGPLAARGQGVAVRGEGTKPTQGKCFFPYQVPISWGHALAGPGPLAPFPGV